jgi:hypothetical protein
LYARTPRTTYWQDTGFTAFRWALHGVARRRTNAASVGRTVKGAEVIEGRHAVAAGHMVLACCAAPDGDPLKPERGADAMKMFVLMTALLVGTCHAAEIRVLNDSGADMKIVIVGTIDYGDIKAGAVTDYQHWDEAYRYAYVSVIAEGKRIESVPIDYVGESRLGEGKFTYVLTLQQMRFNSRLDIHAIRDER